MSPRTELQNEEIRRETEGKIITAALALFVRNGFDGTSIKDIATLANISVGLVYRHFSSKQDLFNHILKDGYTGMHYVTDHIKSTSDPIEALRNVAKIMVSEINSGADYINTHLVISHALMTYDDPLIEDIKIADIKLVEAIEEKICDGQLQGLFIQGCSRTYAWMFLSNIEGTIKAAHIFPNHHKIPTVDNLLYYLMEDKK